MCYKSGVPTNYFESIIYQNATTLWIYFEKNIKTSGNTSNLKRHLKNPHKQILSKKRLVAGLQNNPETEQVGNVNASPNFNFELNNESDTS